MGYNLEIQGVRNAEPDSSKGSTRRVRATKSGAPTARSIAIDILRSRVHSDKGTITRAELITEGVQAGSTTPAMSQVGPRLVHEGILLSGPRAGVYGINHNRLVKRTVNAQEE